MDLYRFLLDMFSIHMTDMVKIKGLLAVRLRCFIILESNTSFALYC